MTANQRRLVAGCTAIVSLVIVVYITWLWNEMEGVTDLYEYIPAVAIAVIVGVTAWLTLRDHT